MKIIGYASTTSIKLGEKILFHLGLEPESNPGPANFRVENITDPTMSISLTETVDRQPLLTNTGMDFGWEPTIEFTIPTDWRPGLYRLIAIQEPRNRNISNFVVRPHSAGTTSKTLVNISYLTAAAYTNRGGKSFYEPKPDNERARKVSFNRPSDLPRLAHSTAPDTYIQEAALITWLHQQGIGSECCSSIDLHAEPDLLQHYHCLVIAYHDEYWTKAMRDNCERFVQNGGNMIVLSGNTCYRQVRLEDENRTVVFYKYASLDPLTGENNDEVTTAWAEPPVNRPQNNLLGVGFTHGAFKPETLNSNDNHHFQIRFPDHWVMKDVEPLKTSAFIDYETDAAAYVEEPEGYPRVTGEEGTPLNLTVLASADLRDWKEKPGRATMSIYSRNGTVFNAATTQWVDALETDPAVAQITKNVFARLSRPVSWDWELVGHANKATAMTAVDGRLFLSNSNNELWRRFPVGADVPWTKIGHVNKVTSMMSSGGRIYFATADNRIMSRPTTEAEVDWQDLGVGPASGIKAMAAAGGMHYVIDNEGLLHRRMAGENIVGNFQKVDAFEPNPDIVALTSYSDILFASTSSNRLLRTNRDFIAESDQWHDIHHCDFSVGLAVVEWMLYVATSKSGLWRIDLSSLAQP